MNATETHSSWWRHQMETFSALLAICAGNSPVPGEFPAQWPVTRSFDVFFDLRPNKRLSKQWWGWWFETLSCPLWRHRNVAGAARQQALTELMLTPSYVAIWWHWVTISYMINQMRHHAKYKVAVLKLRLRISCHKMILSQDKIKVYNCKWSPTIQFMS